LEESKPKSWFFDIFEETEVQQNLGTMTHFADTLEISDDESKSSISDGRGKENIPPNEIYTPAATFSPIPAAIITTETATTSRKDLMTDEPRTPLGDLNPSDYYAAGQDATSVVLVSEEEDMPEEQPEQAAHNNDLLSTTTPFNFTTDSPAPPAEDQSMMSHSELSCLLLGAAASIHIPLAGDDQHQRGGLELGLFDTYASGGGVGGLAAVDGEGPTEKAEIEIWESGSAKDEGEKVDMEGGIFTDLL
jgi:hypothetical protein